jgi:hypothetical protein
MQMSAGCYCLPGIAMFGGIMVDISSGLLVAVVATAAIVVVNQCFDLLECSAMVSLML